MYGYVSGVYECDTDAGDLGGKSCVTPSLSVCSFAQQGPLETALCWYLYHADVRSIMTSSLPGHAAITVGWGTENGVKVRTHN